MKIAVAPFQQGNADTVNVTALRLIQGNRLRQKTIEQAGIAFNLFAQATVKHFYHILDARGLIMEIFHRQRFQLLTGFIA